MARRPLLIHESSDLSESPSITPALPSLGFDAGPVISYDSSFDSHPDVSPPASPAPASQRSGYSALTIENPEGDDGFAMDKSGERGGRLRERAGGLGIAPSAASTPSPHLPPGGIKRTSTIPRAPVSARTASIIKSPSIGSPPNTGDPLMGGFPGDSSGASTPDLRRDRAAFSPRNEPIGEYEEYNAGNFHHFRSMDSIQSNDYQRYLHSDDTARLRDNRKSMSMRSAYEVDFRPTTECPTARDFYISRFSFLSITIIILCLFSTAFSGIFLGIALRGPRWGRHITSHGPLKPADANTLTSIMAKLIELSFVTAFVAFLGQVLSRRAFMKEQGKGITLAEMSMWRWVVQPGTLITHWETAKYAGITFLGILSLLSALVATMYAPACTALVQPVLKFGSWENKLMLGEVKASFSNMNYVRAICESPIRTDSSENKGSSCLQIKHAAQGYRNYQRYLEYWNTASNTGNGTRIQKERPKGFAMLHENTTITPSWVNVIDTKEVSKQYKRAVNNVSLAFPHAGVFQAARDARNNIMQPEDLDNMGIYALKASVPSPVMHVLCANLDKDELRPLIYETWGPRGHIVNISSWMTQQNLATTTNKTVVDDLFGWTKQHPAQIDYPPVFGRYPRPFNTIMNHTNWAYGRDSIYLLGQGGNDTSSDLTGIYVLCQIRVTVSTNCSTVYAASGTGGEMEAVCEDETDDFAFQKKNPESKPITRAPDWRDIGFDWANALSLNTGIMDANASNSRILTQLILREGGGEGMAAKGEIDLSTKLPSPAEALAVMAGGTLIMGSMDSPFVEFYNYTNTTLPQPETQTFMAALLAQQYASGGADRGALAWSPVLLLVFLMNVFVLAYFLLHRGLVTDFSEPPNLFSLAVNSPPSEMLKGSCGGGPEGDQWVGKWYVGKEGGHLFIEPGLGMGPRVRSERAHIEHAHGHHAHAHGGKGAGGVKGVIAAVQHWWGNLKNTKLTMVGDGRAASSGTSSGGNRGWTAPFTSFRKAKGTTGKEASRHVDFELVESGNAGRSPGIGVREGVERDGDKRLSQVERHYDDLAKRRSVL